MSSKILPIDIPPAVTYPACTANFSVAMSHKSFDAWFYSNNIMLLLDKDVVGEQGRFAMLEFFPFNCPLVKESEIPSFFYSDPEKIIETLVSFINNRYYVMLEVDSFYIEGTSCYKNYHSWQPVLVYGYESDQFFNVAGFFHNAQYELKKIHFNSVQKAFAAGQDTLEEKFCQCGNTIKLLACRNEFSYYFDLDKVKEQLTDYVESNTPKEYLFQEILDIRAAREFVFGAAIYDVVIQYFEVISTKKAECDLRLLHTLLQHKIVWEKRIDYMKKSNILSAGVAEKFQETTHELTNKIALAHNKIVRHNLNPRNSSIDMVCSLLADVKVKELQFGADLLAAIS